MDERRKYPRFKAGIEVHWKKVVPPPERSARHISHTRDASAGGVCLVLHAGISVGDRLELEIQSPGEDKIKVEGRVVWLDRQARVPGRTEPVCEGGVQFADMEEKTRLTIEKILQDHFKGGSRK